MENKGKKLNRLYDKGTKQWFDVPADFFEKYDKERDAFRKKMQDHGPLRVPLQEGLALRHDVRRLRVSACG